MFRGFKNFLMRGDVIVIAVGLVTALAFSTLIKAFTDFVINPIIAQAQGGTAVGLGWQLGQPGNQATYLDVGQLISALAYFVIFTNVTAAWYSPRGRVCERTPASRAALRPG